MLYPQYFIDDLKDRTDLVRIIEPYAQLKKKGANWMACCPFHQEKTPSFSVNPAKGFYKCFGCGKGGNAYTFLMDIEGLNFPEAIKRVAEITGVPLPEPENDEQYARGRQRREEKKKLADQIIELNQMALEFWEAELQGKSKNAKNANEYLSRRGIDEDTQKAFRIGFSPDTWDSLLNHLKQKGVDEKLIEQSGLVSVNEEKNRVFDRFRGRIMFPVLDVNGRPAAFGARAMGDEQPKYLNSPETPAYTKGQHLYGLFQSKEEIRRKKFAILVEGYLDLIALYQFGIRNTVASLGTAFTPEQSKLLGRFTKRVVINYDGDPAGVKAARKAIDILLPNDFEIKVLILPDGKDPDDFVREFGAETYNEARGGAVAFLQFVLVAAMTDRSIGNPKQKADAIEEVLPVLSLIRNPIQKRESFDQAMSYFRVEKGELQNKLWYAVKHGGSSDGDTVVKQVRRAAQAKITVAERQLLELLVYDTELQDHILPLLETTDYGPLATANVFKALIELHKRKQPATLESVNELIGDDDIAHDFVPVLLMAEPRRETGEVIDEVLHRSENCLFTLRRMAISNHLLEVSQELIAAEHRGDLARVGELVQEHLDLSRMKQELISKIVET
jgi:DNA primase